MDEQVSNLSGRVLRLESFNRVHLVVSSLAVAAIVVVGQLPPIWADKDGPKSFSAGEFVLVDHSGRTTARLAAAPKGGAALTFYDPHGKRTVSFGFTDDANVAGTNLYDGNILAAGKGINRGGIGIGGPNLPSALEPFGSSGFGMAIFQPNGIKVLGSGTGLDRSGPAVSTADSNGTGRTFEGVVSSTQAGLFVSDSDGNTRTGVEVNQAGNLDGMFSLAVNGTLQSVTGGAYDGSNAFNVLYNAAGTIEGLKVVNGDGSLSGDFVSDANGTLRVESYQDPTRTPVQGVQVFDASGSPVAHLP